MAKSAKGKERERPTRKLSSENAEIFTSSIHSNLSTGDKGEITVERAIKPRPPRNQSLHETVKSHIARNNYVESRDFKLAPTSSRHSESDAATETLLPRLSDPDAPSLLSRLSDPQTPSLIVLPAASGDAGQLSPETPNATLTTIEARARLLARLNREKKLAEHTRSELATQGSTTA